MAYSCCFGFGRNLDFRDFLQKSLITSITDPKPIMKISSVKFIHTDFECSADCLKKSEQPIRVLQSSEV